MHDRITGRHRLGLEQVSGRYFASSKPRKSAKRSYDETAAARLWQASADLTAGTGSGS